MKRKSIKIRRSWGSLRPAQRPHSTKHGKKGYSRQVNKRVLREELVRAR